MRLASLQSLTPGDLAAWADLARHAVESNPFFEPAFVMAACRSPNAEQPFLLVREDERAWTAAMPVRATRLLGRGIALSTWRHPYSSVGTPLVAEDHLEDFAEAIVAHLENRRDGRYLMLRRTVDVVVMEAIRSAAVEAPALRVIFERTAERGVLERRPEPGEHPSLKRRHRKELARRSRRLTEDLGLEPAVRDRSDCRAAVEQFLRLEASGWKGKQGTAMQTAGDADVFRAICAHFAKEGRLQMLSLEAGERPLAMQCNISGRDTLFNFKVAFDEELRRYGPGVQLDVDGMRIFHSERDEKLFDSCSDPADELVNRLWPDRLSVSTMAIGPDRPSGSLVGWALDVAYRRRMGGAG